MATRNCNSRLCAALLVISLISSFPSPGQDTDRDTSYVRLNYKKTEAMIPMRDGVRLFTAIYLPLDSSRSYPILLTRSPYGSRPYGESALRTSLGPSRWEEREGYIFVYQDVRGRFMSEGDFVDIRPYNPNKNKGLPVDESSDVYDTIDWLLKHLPATNGRVGITGISYPGFYSTMGLIDAHPALTAGSPQAPIADWFIGDDDHHNGALFLAESFSFFSNFGQRRPEPLMRYPTRYRMQSQDAYAFFLDMGPLRNTELLHMKGEVPYWNDLMSHETYDEFWQARSVLPHLKGIRPAVMTVGGWFDKEDLYGALNTYKTIEKNNPKAFNILVMGPWSHGQWNRNPGERLGEISFGSETGTWFRQHVQAPFFRATLKGGSLPDLAEATVFETGANHWHFLDHWPPSGLQPARWYMHPGGHLDTVAPPAKGGASRYVSDPSKPVPHSAEIGPSVRPTYMIEDQRFASRRPDVLVFAGDPLQREYAIAGPILVDIYVSTTGTDADWIVKLIDVFPDSARSEIPTSPPRGGYQMLVRGDVLRGKFRNSFSAPEPFVPGRVTSVRFTLQDIFHQFKRGHRIMVQVQSSWFPLVDRNPQRFLNIREARASDFQKAEHRVYHSARYPSAIILGTWTHAE